MKIQALLTFIAVSCIVITGCGINGLTIEHPTGAATQPPPPPPPPAAPLQIEVTFAANDSNGNPMTFASVHSVQSLGPATFAIDGNGFQVVSQVDPDPSTALYSFYFSALPNCPIDIHLFFLDDLNSSIPLQRQLIVGISAFSQIANQYFLLDISSAATLAQTFEACGTIVTVQFQTTGGS